MNKTITIRLEKPETQDLKKAIEENMLEIKCKLENMLFIRNPDEPYFNNKRVDKFVSDKTGGLFTEAIIKNAIRKNKINVSLSSVSFKEELGSKILELDLLPNESFRKEFEQERDRTSYLIKEMTNIDKNTAKRLFDEITKGKIE